MQIDTLHGEIALVEKRREKAIREGRDAHQNWRAAVREKAHLDTYLVALQEELRRLEPLAEVEQLIESWDKDHD